MHWLCFEPSLCGPLVVFSEFVFCTITVVVLFACVCTPDLVCSTPRLCCFLPATLQTHKLCRHYTLCCSNTHCFLPSKNGTYPLYVSRHYRRVIRMVLRRMSWGVSVVLMYTTVLCESFCLCLMCSQCILFMEEGSVYIPST